MSRWHQEARWSMRRSGGRWTWSGRDGGETPGRMRRRGEPERWRRDDTGECERHVTYDTWYCVARDMSYCVILCRMELRQKSKVEENERRKVEDRRWRERENYAGLREALNYEQQENNRVTKSKLWFQFNLSECYSLIEIIGWWTKPKISVWTRGKNFFLQKPKIG